MGPQLFAAIIGGGLLVYSLSDLLRKYSRELVRERLILDTRKTLAIYDSVDDSEERLKVAEDRYHEARQKYAEFSREHVASTLVSYETAEGIVTLDPRDNNSIRDFVEAMKERPSERQVVTR